MIEYFGISLLAQLITMIILGYLAGSIPFGLILTKISGMGDVRTIGSGNIGATNVLRTGSKSLAFFVLISYEQHYCWTFGQYLCSLIEPENRVPFHKRPSFVFIKAHFHERRPSLLLVLSVISTALTIISYHWTVNYGHSNFRNILLKQLLCMFVMLPLPKTR